MPFLCADLNFFDFPSEKNLRKKWSTFCRRADKEFQSTANLHVCFQHFNAKNIVKTWCGIKKVVNGALPTIFNPQEVPSGTSEREKRMISRRGKRNSKDEIGSISAALWCRSSPKRDSGEGARAPFPLKAAKYEIHKPSTCRATLFRC